jgi:tetratricopeptide (TPR) repeat protein
VRSQAVEEFRVYELSGRLEDLEQAISRIEEAASMVPSDHWCRVEFLHHEVQYRKHLYRVSPSANTLDAVINVYSGCINSLPDWHPVYTLGGAPLRSELAEFVLQKYRRTRQPKLLQQVKALLEDAISISEDTIIDVYPELQGNVLHHRSIMLLDRYHLEDPNSEASQINLQLSVEAANLAILVDVRNPTDRSKHLQQFAETLLHRFQVLGDPDDIDCAIIVAEEAVRTMRNNDAHWIGCNEILARTLEKRFQIGGIENDFSKALNRRQKAIERCERVDAPAVDIAMAYGSYGGQLLTKHDISGSLHDLDDAMAKTVKACKIDPESASPMRSSWWLTLVNILHKYYVHTEDQDHLNMAIVVALDIWNSSVEATTDDCVLPDTFSRLLSARYRYNQDPGDLYAAFELSKIAVSLGGESHMLGIINNAAITSAKLAEVTKDQAAIFATILYSDRALKLIQSRPNSVHYTGMMMNQSMSMVKVLDATHEEETSMETTLQPQLISAAVDCANVAIQTCPRESPLRPVVLEHGANLYLRQYGMDGWARAASFLEEALILPQLLPSEGIRICRRLAGWYRKREDFEKLSEVLKRAIHLMPLLSLKATERTFQERRVSAISSVAQVAFAAALASKKDLVEALELLELGRGVVLGYQIDARSEDALLREQCPEKFERFSKLRQAINHSLNHSKSFGNYDDARKALGNLNEVVAEIRSIPGFDRFLLGPSKEQMMKLAKDGPIVVLNCTSIRSDAVIITMHGINLLNLKDLDYVVLLKCMKLMEKVRSSTDPSLIQENNKRFEKLLLWFWQKIADPVWSELEQNHLHHYSFAGLPRIWWVCVGELSLAPIHAAGSFKKGGKNMPSKAISSYIPTIKSLQFVREKQILDVPDVVKVLGASMVETPGEDNLPSAKREIEAVSELIRGRAKHNTEVDIIPQPKADTVYGKLSEDYSIVHFACHGFTKTSTSADSQSALVFVREDTWLEKHLSKDMDITYSCEECAKVVLS